MRLLRSFLRTFFHHLYHGLSPLYDLVAWSVSLGAWKAWGRTALSFVEGDTVLELGPGPGHLQVGLSEGPWSTLGLDESPQMLARASQRLRGRALIEACARRCPGAAVRIRESGYDRQRIPRRIHRRRADPNGGVADATARRAVGDHPLGATLGDPLAVRGHPSGAHQGVGGPARSFAARWIHDRVALRTEQPRSGGGDSGTKTGAVVE
jgi:hypothetical protein